MASYGLVLHNLVVEEVPKLEQLLDVEKMVNMITAEHVGAQNVEDVRMMFRWILSEPPLQLDPETILEVCRVADSLLNFPRP
jgi:hypothetical protein